MPLPDAAQLAHSARVLDTVRAAIAARGGFLPFDEYLDIVLYAPGLGYYSAGATKLGAAGDFITAPELTPLFGACLARQCADLLAPLGEGELLELGPGSGALAASLLPALAALGALPRRYLLLEVSADLRERQRARLAALPAELRARIEWIGSPPAAGFRGLMLANEVADALPFQCFEWSAPARRGTLAERGVGVDADGSLAWRARPATPALAAELARMTAISALEWEPGQRGECCLRLDGWIAALAAGLDEGALLLIDYGHARGELHHPLRAAGTLRCHYRQRVHEDPFLWPGLSDLTCSVDFTRIAEAGSAAGLEVAGYCTQAALLLANGIEALVAAIDEPRAHAAAAAAVRQLLLPEAMGDAFKAILLTRGLPGDLRGFSLQDLRSRL